MFWQEQCPVRGPGLTHAHSARCAGEHALDQCCECGGSYPRPAAGSPVQMSPNDIRARLRSLGIQSVSEDDPVNEEPAAPDHTADEFVEPRAITGEGPTGPKWHWGRGEATPRFLARVKSFVEFRAWMAERGLIEHEPTLAEQEQ